MYFVYNADMPMADQVYTYPTLKEARAKVRVLNHQSDLCGGPDDLYDTRRFTSWREFVDAMSRGK